MNAQMLHLDDVTFFPATYSDEHGSWFHPVSLKGQMFLIDQQTADRLCDRLDHELPPPLKAGDAIFDISSNKMVPYVPSAS